MECFVFWQLLRYRIYLVTLDDGKFRADKKQNETCILRRQKAKDERKS